MAGFRGQAPVVAFLFFRATLPVIGFVVAFFYLFFVNDFGLAPIVRLGLSIGGAYLGFYFPNIFISNLIQRRQKSIKGVFPDALDLLLICVQAGMSVEAAMNKVASEIGSRSIELAEEFSLTTAELSYLQERRQAYENLGKRTGIPVVRAVGTSLIQAERYGTAVGQALARAGQGKPRHAHGGSREEGGRLAAQAHRAHDPVLPAGAVRRHPGARRHPVPGHARRPPLGSARPGRERSSRSFERTKKSGGRLDGAPPPLPPILVSTSGGRPWLWSPAAWGRPTACRISPHPAA